MSLLQLSAVELRQQLAARQVSALETADFYLDLIERDDPRIGAFLHVDPEHVRRQARGVDQRIQAGDRVGPLAGVPVAVKDVICTADSPTTCGSRMLADYRSPYEATLAARLREAGAVILGKTNMDEFAMGGSTENSAFQVTRNPWDLKRVPGGSSGGAAACIAADLAPLSVGTDTGGSIRQPASFCGVTGMKPTYGRVSRYGLIAFASSLDQAGPLAHSAADAAMLLDVISGADPRDATCIDATPTRALDHLNEPLAGCRIGVLEELFGDLSARSSNLLGEAVAEFQRLGAVVQTASLPHQRYSIAAYYVIAPCEASSNLARYDGAHYGFRAALDADSRAGHSTPLEEMYCRSRSEGLGAEVKRRMILGAYALSAGYYDAYYLKAQKVRRLIREDYVAAFRTCDLLLGPATPTTAFALGEKSDDPLAMYLGDLFTVGANLAGVPAVSLPCGFDSNGLPVGLQLQAPAMGDERLLAAAHQYQTATDWHQQRPALP